MPRKKETIIQKSFLCSNPTCGKSFATTLKTTNVGLQDSKPYEACPYCLTELELQPTTSTIDKSRIEKPFEFSEIKANVPSAKETNSAHPAQECAHHLGYLSERSRKEKIPDECMVCERIVQCMLKTLSS